MIRSLYTIFRTPERCNHHLRFSLPGKSKICLICHCAKIDDILLVECTENRKLSSARIIEIIHQFRIVNSVLEVPLEQKQVEILLPPVLHTSLALLQQHNDEVGAVVSQGLEKICQEVPMSMLDNFLENLSVQILEKTSYGHIEALLVLIRRKECLNSFLKKHSPVVLPKLFHELENHESNGQWADRNAAGDTKRNAENSATMDVTRDSLKVIIKLIDVFEACLPSDVLLLVNDENIENSEFFMLASPFPIFSQNLRSLFSPCMSLLSLTQVTEMTALSVKILSFFGKLHRHPETLRYIFCDNVGLKLCSMIKRMLYSRSEEVKTAALSLVHRMVVTYQRIMDDSTADKSFIEDFPSAMTQVDLIHFITEAMATSSGALFKTAIQVLEQINNIYVFRQGTMIPVLEATLRISRLLIPDSISDLSVYKALNNFILSILTTLESVSPSIQHQLMYLFEKMPSTWTAVQYLPWIKLLLFCQEAELRRNLWSIFIGFVQRSKDIGRNHCVTPLKCVLLIAYALTKCSTNAEGQAEPANVPNQQDLPKQLMAKIMDVSFLPSAIALALHGKAEEDSMYMSVLLNLLLNYPAKYLKPGNSSFGKYTSETITVIFDSELPEDIISQAGDDPSYEITVDLPPTTISMDGSYCWSANQYMLMLGSIRFNPELITSKQLYDMWNQNMARVLTICYPLHLEQFGDILNDGIAGENLHDTSLEQFLQKILEKLDIDSLNWAKAIRKDTYLLDSNMDTKLIHDGTLAVFYFYAMFAGKNLVQFLDDAFVDRFCSFLYECIERYKVPMEERKLGWTPISFYFRVALMIASSLPGDKGSQFVTVFETLLVEVAEAKTHFKNDVMIYHSSVFMYVLKWEVLVDHMSVVENWLIKDRHSCVSFFKDGNFDDQLNSEINNSLIALAAQGNQETSQLAIDFVHFRRKHRNSFHFDINYIKGVLFRLINEISAIEDHSNFLHLVRFSNVIHLACQDDFLFCNDNNFLTNFLHNIIRIMLKYSDVSLVGRRCLELLLKILKNKEALKNVNQYLISHKELIRFLGTKLEVDKNNEIRVQECVFAHKLLAILINQNIDKFSTSTGTAEEPLVVWRLASVFTYIHSITQVEIIEFLVAVFKSNFKCPLIQVEELSQPAPHFAKVLFNLLFHLQALTHKVTFRETKDVIWEILCEFLRLAEHKSELVKHPTFKMDVIYQPWMKVAVSHLLAQCVPSKAPMMSLEFLQKWTRLILHDKLENKTKRSPMQQRFVFDQYTGVFKNIQDAMKKDPSQATREERQTIPQCSNEGTRLFDIARKCSLICKISKNCEIFLSSADVDA